MSGLRFVWFRLKNKASLSERVSVWPFVNSNIIAGILISVLSASVSCLIKQRQPLNSCFYQRVGEVVSVNWSNPGAAFADSSPDLV